MSKIIFFSPWHFQKHNPQKLNARMKLTLLAAWKKQNEGLPFGPSDIKGAFMALIKRGLIIRTDVIINNTTESSWQITKEAISLLKSMQADRSIRNA
ncbi:MAG: hypothetical protein M3139_09565 [Bacteroidota bacterium]|nr:hypothetical protein [Bacteroidota bacterium]